MAGDMSAALEENLKSLGLPMPEPSAPAPVKSDSSTDGEEEQEDEEAYSFDDSSDAEDGSSAATDPPVLSRVGSSPKAADDDAGAAAPVMRLRQLSIRSLPGRDDIEVAKFDSAREFVDALGPYEHWSIAPLIGPSTRALESSAELRRAVWLGAYSRSRGRLECVGTPSNSAHRPGSLSRGSTTAPSSSPSRRAPTRCRART